MWKRKNAVAAGLLFIAGCAAPTSESPGDLNEVGNVPEAVANLAAPNQDLTSARLRPEDGCYWYEHSGPVETTLVPLRAVGGSPICTARQS
ncbi:hypothetical protein [Roseovarius sp. MBR-78]|jgi:hypothetical protein|uniref:hypothetical protein n=1 Tax=Roseovarius sp. MBR-78 TaxID=3156460 RepID=UPI003396E4FD